MTLLWALALMITTWRVTRILVVENFPPTRAVRDWVLDTFGVFDESGAVVRGWRWGGLGYTIAYLWTCQWCMSVWVGALVYAAWWWLGPTVMLPVVVVAAASGLSGLISIIDDVAGEAEGALKRWRT